MGLGEKLKLLRQKNNLTIEELANRCELTKGYISQLERDISSPSIETLQNILEVLGTTLGDFFKQEKNRQFVYKPEDRYVVEQEQYSIEWLVPNAHVNELEPILLSLKPYGESQRLLPFEGEIFGYVLKGNIEVISGSRTQRANPQDSFYLYGNNQHYLKNVTNDVAEILWISTPPIF
ncbi:helix-turn-helix domain-containing protein [Spiroplasma chrysopicola]|uniref:Xre family transcriptional regulator n=1 Tax=Spiroplasma chrysopicola DF-1 TaxID=1276227 RepID=R4UA07_9MOLU|nr:XRE family transcriptional regulator [Spiroplasma chrysopicola]AGM24694.1 Xre family transcriptional regulator [Spiroplasma chrysopicola DF-1]